MRKKWPPPVSKTPPFYSSAHLAARLSDQSRPGTEGCVEWTGFVNRGGYGQISAHLKGCKNGRTFTLLAHRIAFWIASGRWPEWPMMVCHHCDNPRCINPHHLYEGTARQNYEDRKERHVYVKPWRAHNHAQLRKMTDEDVTTARRLFFGVNGNSKRRRGSFNPNSLQQISNETGLSSATVKRIIAGHPTSSRHWKNKKEDPHQIRQKIINLAKNHLDKKPMWNMRTLSARFRVAEQSMRNAIYGKTYKHVAMPIADSGIDDKHQPPTEIS